MKRILFALPFVLWLSGGPLFAEAEQENAASGGTATLLKVQDAIGPATSDYIRRGITEAVERGDVIVILELDTPGGLDSAMREIIKEILASPLPVATYVSPRGARAASAGTYILYASHIAARATSTNLGSATPIPVGAAPAPAREPNKKDDEEGEPTGGAGDTATDMKRKMMNDAVAYIRGLAETHGRNADWAEKAVREAANLTAEEALELGVIDIVARDTGDLLAQADGRAVQMADGERVVATGNLVLERFEPDWRNRLLAVITNPTVAYLLMLIGIYGLVFEGYNPGAIVPGVVGAICLLLALYAFQVLPVNYAGLALILLGIVLMAAEAFVPSFGALGIGGILAFVIGSIILIDTEKAPGLAVSKPLIGGLALFSGALVMSIIYFAMRGHRRPVETGMEGMIDHLAEAREDFERTGSVFIHGESWSAETSAPVKAGQKVKVTAVDGLLLKVQPVE